MLDIEIKTIEHKEQRYPTVGDWQQLPVGTVKINVSNMHNWRMELCVAIHELIEYALCKYHEVDEMAVDVFDMKYEHDRPEGDTSEPGDDPGSPYVSEHCFATGVERLLANELGLKWKVHEDVINAL
jgi:hypothetical protein